MDDSYYLNDMAGQKQKESVWGLILFAGLALVIGIVANKYVNKSAMGIAFGITSMIIVSLVNIRKALILGLVFAAFNGAHLLIDTEVTIQTEPLLNKSMKDLLLLGVIISYLKTMIIEKLRPVDVNIIVPIAIFQFFVFAHGLIITDGAFLLTLTWYRHYIGHTMLIFIAFSAFRNFEDVLLLFKWMLVAATVIVTMGFVEQILDLPTQFQDVVEFWIFNRRVISTLGQPVNVFQYIGLPFFYILIGWTTNRINIVKALIWLSVLGCGIFMTFTRAAFIAFPLAFFMLTFVIKKAKAFYIGIIMLLVVIFVFPVVMAARDQYGLASRSVIGSRDVMIKKSLEEIFSDSKTLFIGKGMGYGYEYSPIKTSFKTTDNIYMSWWRSTGMFGMFFFMFFFTWAGIKLIKTYKKCQTPAGQHIVAAVMVYYFMLLANGMVNEVFKFYPATFILWISVGIAFSVPYMEQEEWYAAGMQNYLENDFINE